MKHNKIYRSVFIITVFLVVLVRGAFAQTERKLSLPEAIELSIKTSGFLKISNVKVDEAIANCQQAKNNQLPDLKTSATYMRLNNPTVDLKIKLGSSSSKPAPSPKVNELSYAITNLSVPVFSGLKIRYAIESAKYQERATRLDAENQKEDVVENAIGAYCNLYKAQKAVELVQKNLEQQDQRVTDFTNLEKNGVLALNDLLKAKLQQSNTEVTLLDAENNLKITRINLSLMIGLPENTELVVDSTAFQDMEDIGLVANWEQLAFQNRKDLASLAMQEHATATSIKSAKGDYYPGLALTGGYIAANVPGLLTITNALNIGMGLQYNIGSIWKNSSKVDAAKARLIQVEATRGIMADAVRLQINQAYQNYLLSARKIDVYVKAIEQAKENYRISKNKYDNHLMTISDLLDADVIQLQAELNFAQSKADAYTAYKKLQQAAGVLVINKK